MFVKKLFYHFSIDDVIDSFIEVSDKNIPPYKHPFFSYLLKIHKLFDTNIDLYLFYQNTINGKLRTLKDVSAKNFKKWFEDNPWLKLGPHALDYDTAPYNQSVSEQKNTLDKIYAEIERFASEKNLANFLRLHYFSESFELAKYFKGKKVSALFTTDKNSISYRMPQSFKQKLMKKGYVKFKEMEFMRSHFRLENLANQKLTRESLEKIIYNLVNQYGIVIFFTHEREIPKLQVQKLTISALEILEKKGLKGI